MANAKTASQTHSERVLDLIEITGAIIDQTSTLVTTKEAQDKKIANLIPQAVEALLKNERIEQHEKDAAAKLLADPVKALEILIKTAQHRNDTERTALGKPEGQQKKAGYDSLKDGYVGRRSRPDEPESYKALKRGLGL